MFQFATLMKATVYHVRPSLFSQDQGIFPQWTSQDLFEDFNENLLHTGEEFQLDNEAQDSEYD